MIPTPHKVGDLIEVNGCWFVLGDFVYDSARSTPPSLTARAVIQHIKLNIHVGWPPPTPDLDTGFHPKHTMGRK